MSETKDPIRELSDAELVARWNAIEWPSDEGNALADEIERRNLDL